MQNIYLPHKEVRAPFIELTDKVAKVSRNRNTGHDIYLWVRQAAIAAGLVEHNSPGNLYSLLTGVPEGYLFGLFKKCKVDIGLDWQKAAADSFINYNKMCIINKAKFDILLKSEQPQIKALFNRMRNQFNQIWLASQGSGYNLVTGDTIDIYARKTYENRISAHYTTKAALFCRRSSNVFYRIHNGTKLGNVYETKSHRYVSVPHKGYHIWRKEEGAPLRVFDYCNLIFVFKTAFEGRPVGVSSYDAKATQGHVSDAFVKACNSVGLLQPNSQDVNRRLVREYSGKGVIATLDVKGGNSAIHKGWLELMPYAMKKWLERERVSEYKIQGIEIPLSVDMLVPAGVGWTFPIETLVFYVAITATLGYNDFLPTEHTGVIIFGDDIIIPTQVYDKVVKALSLFGIEINLEKSYDGTRQLESCGRHYENGVSIKHPSIKRVGDLHSIYAVCNRVRDAYFYEHDNSWRDDCYRVFYENLINNIDEADVLYTPPHLGDVGISTPIPNLRWSVSLSALEQRGWLNQFKPWRVRSKPIFDHNGQLATYHLVVQVVKEEKLPEMVRFNELRYPAETLMMGISHPSLRGSGFINKQKIPAEKVARMSDAELHEMEIMGGLYPKVIPIHTKHHTTRAYWTYVGLTPEGWGISDDDPLSIFDRLSQNHRYDVEPGRKATKTFLLNVHRTGERYIDPGEENRQRHRSLLAAQAMEQEQLLKDALESANEQALDLQDELVSLLFGED